MKKNFFSLFKGFSLIELLISLIVISLITTAFAPIISKQVKRAGISVGQSGGKISNQCDSINPNCQLCQGNECLVCTLNCPDGQYADKEACECKSCNSFGACSRCTKDGCTQCNGGYGLINKRCDNQCAAGTYSNGSGACTACQDKKFSNAGASSCTDCPAGKTHNSNHTACIDITCSADEFVPSGTSVCAKCNSVYANCAKCDKDSGCSECLLGYGLVSGVCKPYIKPRNQADCDQFNGAIFTPINNDGTGICVTKRNVGDPDGPTIDFPGKIITEVAEDHSGNLIPWNGNKPVSRCISGGGATRTVGTTTTDGTKTSNCSGTIANVSRGSSYLKFNYESCKRTLCNYNASQYACSQYKTEKTKAGDWRLPTKSEAAVWKDIINNKEPSSNGKTGSEKFTSDSKSQIQKYKGGSGLQFCDNASGYGSPRCGYASKRCHYTQCHAYGIWAYDPTGSKTIPVHQFIPGVICLPEAKNCNSFNVTYYTIEGLPFAFSLHKGVAYLGSDLGDDEKVKIKDSESVTAEYMSARCVLDKFIE